MYFYKRVHSLFRYFLHAKDFYCWSSKGILIQFGTSLLIGFSSMDRISGLNDTKQLSLRASAPVARSVSSVAKYEPRTILGV